MLKLQQTFLISNKRQVKILATHQKYQDKQTQFQCFI